MKNFFKKSKNKSGFTLLEILLVVAAIAILAGIVILAINPTKQLGDTRNAQRRSDVNTLLSATYQYAIDNNGAVPSAITTGTCSTATNEVCKSGGTCTNLTDLSATLTLNEKYLVAIPEDPSGSANVNGTGYFLFKDAYNRITVCAPLAEQGATITVTR